ncbi:hypothetical protein PROPHIGD43A-1_103 [Mycobacterium phage prophiGD43A-1]|nr:hypothetical protein PROPHIGD43A-1_103 [Mycobacterium phage prophiGD43A-1]
MVVLMARMLGRNGHEPLFCKYGWKCRCERAGRSAAHRKRGGQAVDMSRRILRRRESRTWRTDMAGEY